MRLMLGSLKDSFWVRSILAGLIATAIWTVFSDIAPLLNAIFSSAPGFFLGAVAMTILARRSPPEHVKPGASHPTWDRSRPRTKRLLSATALSLDELYEALFVRSAAVFYSGGGIICLAGLGLLPETPRGGQPSFLIELLGTACVVAALVLLARMTIVAVRLFFRASRVCLSAGVPEKPPRASSI